MNSEKLKTQIDPYNRQKGGGVKDQRIIFVLKNGEDKCVNCWRKRGVVGSLALLVH